MKFVRNLDPVGQLCIQRQTTRVSWSPLRDRQAYDNLHSWQDYQALPHARRIFTCSSDEPQHPYGLQGSERSLRQTRACRCSRMLFATACLRRCARTSKTHSSQCSSRSKLSIQTTSLLPYSITVVHSLPPVCHRWKHSMVSSLFPPTPTKRLSAYFSASYLYQT